MKKLLIMAIFSLLGCNILAQDQGVIDRIKKISVLEPVHMYCIKTDELTSEYLGRVSELPKSDLPYVIEMGEDEIKELDKILETRDKIIGKEKKESRKLKKLKKYFDDPQKAMDRFNEAEALKSRALAIISAAKFCENMVFNTMPKGKLLRLSYSAGNGYAGWRNQVELTRNKDGKGGVLKYEESNLRRYREDQPEEKPKIANVDDSVFVKVYNIITEGQLYDEANYYQPFMDVTDGTSWSLSMKFEDASISTGGYMAGPNHRDALNAVLKYLNEVFRQIYKDPETSQPQ